MNQNQKHNAYIKFHRFQKSREAFYTPKYNKGLADQFRQFVFNYNYYGFNAVDKITSEPIVRIQNHQYKDAVQVYGQSVIAQLKQQRSGVIKHSLFVPEFTPKANTGLDLKEVIKVQRKRMPIGFSERILEIMRQYFTIDILNNSEEITETTKEFLLRPSTQQLFIEAYQRGDGIDDIVRMFSGLQNNRGRLIARTETVTAANKSATIVANDTGLILKKGWLSTKDFRTRPHHREMDGQLIGQNDYFKVKSDKGVIYQMECPGDRGGRDGRLRTPASLVCNCRCAVVHEVVE